MMQVASMHVYIAIHTCMQHALHVGTMATYTASMQVYVI